MTAGVPAEPAPGPATPTPVRVRTALAFPFASPNAQRKLAVLGLWQLIPILGWVALSGYRAEVVQRLERHHPEPMPLPRLQDFVHYLRSGWSPWILEIAGLSTMTGMLAVLAFAINAGLIAAWLAGASTAIVLGVGVVLASIIAGIGTVELSSALAKLEIAGPNTNPGTNPIRLPWVSTLRAHVVFTPAALVVLSFGFVLCGVGLVPALVVVSLAVSHLRWQLYRQHVDRGGKRLKAKKTELLPSEGPRRPNPKSLP